MTKKTKLARVSPEFEKLVNRIATARIVNGKDDRMKSIRRITLAMTRHDKMKEIGNDIIADDLRDDIE